MVGTLGILVFGVVMTYIGYSETVYPLEKAKGYFSRSLSSPSPEIILDYLASVKPLIPNEGNPVWVFPTATTDFGLIHKDISLIMDRLRLLSTLSRDSVAFNTGLMDVRGELTTLEEQITTVQPYVFVSFQNLILSVLWIAIILAIFTFMKRGKEKAMAYEKMIDGK